MVYLHRRRSSPSGNTEPMWRHSDHILFSLAITIGVSSLNIGGPTPICWAFSATKPFAHTSSSSWPPTSLPPVGRRSPLVSYDQPAATTFRSSSTSLRASSSPSNKTKPPPLPKTDDPFLLLGLDPTVDAKEIKRAYRKRAMLYHPDVILTPDSTARDRDEASKDFARINAAYEMLTGGGKGNAGAGSATGSSRGATSSSGYTNQPPHRRQSDYTSSTTGKSINWEDFMPKYDEEDAKYDAGGDSFGSIFSDLINGAAGYAAGVSGKVGGGGIVGDLIDFLERNVDGFESGYDDDKSLSQLLLYGEFDEVASEMDETDILVTSLEKKLNTVENELIQAQADLNVATKFSERLDIEERIAELKARDNVVKGYLKKGKKRLIRLRERYKELMVDGRGGRGYRGSASPNRDSSDSSSRSSDRSEHAQSSSPTAQASSTPTSAPASSSTKSWRDEGFTGSYGRTSSGSRRRSRRGQGQASADEGSTGSDQPSTNAGQQPNQQQQRRTDGSAYSSRSSSSVDSATTTASSSKPTPLEPWVPPHRRTQSSTERDTQFKKRLRELKVDEDFEQLKREMGM